MEKTRKKGLEAEMKGDLKEGMEGENERRQNKTEINNVKFLAVPK